MKITNFEHTGLDRVAAWIKRNHLSGISATELKKVLKTVNIFFVAEGINRVQSMLLCELKASYVQQSQRYVALDQDAFAFPDLPPEDYHRALELGQQALDLYTRMCALKEGGFKGRPKPEHYLYAIPIEDARYILPLAAKTNLSVSMSGDKLWEFFLLFNDRKYEGIFETLKNELEAFLPAELRALFPDDYDSTAELTIIEDFYRTDLARINSEDDLILLSSCQDPDIKAGLGALTSTQSRASSEVLLSWGEEAPVKAKEIVQRVLGYGHESIAEQVRTTFGMMCSLVTYHQQVRHRLPEMFREDFSNLFSDTERPVIVPDSIRNSPFLEEFLNLTEAYRTFSREIYQKLGLGKAMPFILNCQLLKMIMSTNARIDNQMLSERTCLNAQWEIRKLAVKKLKILRELSGVLYEKALPPCLVSKCHEGKMTCGKQQEVRDLFYFRQK
ncbi:MULTISPECIES: FAD-dependent thymidylate synthase [Dehalobacter]|jgi:thymidylate synthase ThyX|uniref:FAD-dependent thymidylate synthase n=2 Tax=Dehalobacter restrictus TaxID=55583 RepID=A0A857DEC8_9FIRM|nr:MULTISPECIES: FAD-dependent thymidylate synthase [Dehalobacter]AHF09080.1 Thymidylate synthase thyX [Dehalobacter restrictus DSM 9455]MDJ0306818.1 FAD-dependent thymidylate synthase [Dehalobacter sp.]OCZ53695.1 thymidylate synthase thyx [Dehalobacter sp. TeCB1]QGZ99619.1 FAD-dependent thymidylate synthase [Dehalobacter restrictus]